MANGEIAPRSSKDASILPYGSTVTVSGRISSAAPRGQVPLVAPFSTQDLVKLDETITWATRSAAVRFSVYFGDFFDKNTDGDPIVAVAKIFAHAPEPQNGCLIAVSPNSHDVIVLYGKNVAHRITDNTAHLGVSAAVPVLKEGNIIDAVIAAIRVIVSVIKP